jgi:hypothetical protein
LGPASLKLLPSHKAMADKTVDKYYKAGKKNERWPLVPRAGGQAVLSFYIVFFRLNLSFNAKNKYFIKILKKFKKVN